MDVNEGISLAVWTTALAVWTTVLCLVCATAAWLWFYAPAGSRTAPSSPAKPALDSTRSMQRGVHLNLVNEDNGDTDIDIIAIHGLDTKSPDTWTWQDQRNPKGVNWLADLLWVDVEKARIFTLDWPADLLQPSDLLPKLDGEIVTLLIDGINRELLAKNKTRDRPILFIASCLGGIILMRALTTAADHECTTSCYCLRKATRGIIFLATPFRGTSFEDVAFWANPGLTAWAFICGRTVGKLLDSVKGSTFDLEALVRKFTRFCQHPNRPFLVFNFYELGMTSLWRKLFPWLPTLLFKGKPLVGRSSATLDIVLEPLPLDRTHGLMNKFGSRDCEDYKKVAGKIKEFIGEIRKGTPLAQADAWIREKCYTEDRLKIERLSGTKLPMDQCYINLSIIERTGEDKDHFNKKSAKESVSQSSPFSLTARLKVETPDGTIQADLPSLFKEREGPDGRKTQPRRIFIRGRAGVGKTTLCKKIVYSFMRGEWPEWTKLFDRVLWVPLRNLKLEERRRQAGYNFFHLFSHEYFSRPKSRKDLAEALSDTLFGVPEKRSRTLFLLDGLDEVSQDLSEGDMSGFLNELLEQPNVIITSRPYGKPPAGLDLELETIGFYPKQVEAYINKVFTEYSDTAVRVQSFLKARSLLQGLMRIPVQLDALCFAWDNKNFNDSSKLDTMTDVYRAIDQSLWKKDIPRLGKKHDDELVTAAHIRTADRTGIENLVLKEILFLESLAFTGLQNDTIEFESKHLDQISRHFAHGILPSKTVSRLSFLRTSDSSAKFNNQTYHFLHLTYQEYFAARYFVRQWKANKRLKCLALNGQKNENPTSIEAIQFLRENKYTVRYDILWRFVAGLLDAEGKAEKFFQAIEDKPHDLLGPTHQRLVMHCLSEVSTEMSLRKRLEVELKEWLLFEYKFTGKTRLASEVEFPELALLDTMQEVEIDGKIKILKWVARRPTIPLPIVILVTSWLEDGEFITGKKDVLLALQAQSSLSDKLLTAVTARLEDENVDVREAALRVLQAQSSLSDELLTAVVARLGDENRNVSLAALGVLQAQSSLSDDLLTAVVARLGDKDWDVRRAALRVLQAQSSLSDELLTAVIARLGDKNVDVRRAASGVLQAQSSLSDELLTAVVARLGDEDGYVRRAASDVLQAQSSLSDKLLTAVVARLGDENGDVRKAALLVLQAQSSLSDKLLTAVVARLGDEDWDVRWAASDVLQAQSSLSDKLLTAVVARLGDKNGDVRWAASRVLQAQSSLSDKLLTAIAARLGDKNGDVRWAALLVLQAQSSLSDELLTAVVVCLGDKNGDVRKAALRVLQAQSSLSDKLLTAVVARLGDEDWDVRRAASDVLQAQSSLSDKLLTAVVARLGDENGDVRKAALHILQAQSNLSDELLTAVVARLGDENGDVRWAASDVLQAQSSLSDKLLTAVVARLGDENEDVRWAASDALQAQSSLSDKLLTAVVARLGDENGDVRKAALLVLQAQSSLSDELLTAVVVCLGDKDWDVRKAALGVLQAQSSLSDKLLTAVVARLGDEDWDVRWAASDVLQAQSSLSDKLLTAVVARLGDKNGDVRKAALLVLQAQSNLSDKLLTAVVARLGDEDRNIRKAALRVLQAQSSLSDALLNAPFVEPLFKFLLRGSFDEQWSWYVIDKASCINMPEWVGRTSIDDGKEFMNMVTRARDLSMGVTNGRSDQPKWDS